MGQIHSPSSLESNPNSWHVNPIWKRYEYIASIARKELANTIATVAGIANDLLDCRAILSKCQGFAADPRGWRRIRNGLKVFGV